MDYFAKPYHRYGYIRVSTKEQNTDRQLAALQSYDIPSGNVYIDKESGKDFNRRQYKRMVRKLKQGDMLIVCSIDRLGRNYTEIIHQWRVITHEKGADIKVLDMPLLDTTYAKDLLGTFIADLVLQVMSFCAQLEREKIHQRQAEGIASAMKNGVVFGRPRLNLPDNFDEIIVKWRNGEFNVKTTAKLCGISVSSLYNKIHELKQTGNWHYES